MIKTETTTIDGKNFKVTQLGYGDGVELLTKLLSIAGSAFEKTEDKESFSLGRLASNLKANDLRMVIEKFALEVNYGGFFSAGGVLEKNGTFLGLTKKVHAA